MGILHCYFSHLGTNSKILSLENRKMCQNDAHRGCMITSAVEIGLNSLGFLITLGALKFQGKFNEVLEKAHQHIDLDINAASVICAFLL